MKKIILLGFMLAMVFFGFKLLNDVNKKTSPNETTKRDLNKKALSLIIMSQADKAIEIYKSEGLNGVQQFSINCYKEFEASPELLNLIRCLSIDITANIIDEEISQMTGFVKDDYFHSISIDVRISQAKDFLPKLKYQDTSKLKSFITPYIIKILSGVKPVSE